MGGAGEEGGVIRTLQTRSRRLTAKHPDTTHSRPPTQPSPPPHLVARPAGKRQEVGAHPGLQIHKVKRRDALHQLDQLVKAAALRQLQARLEGEEELVFGDADVLLGGHDQGVHLECVRVGGGSGG